MRSEKSQKRRDPAKSRRSIIDDSPMHSPTSLVRGMPGTPMAVEEWELLPPLEVIIEAVHTFTRHYFQLGFIHKEDFPGQLRTNPRSVRPFFLLSLLSVSARLTPPLIDHYGSAVQAADSFMERASRVALNELYKEPSLERCQGFYLLSIAQQGSGMKYQSSVGDSEWVGRGYADLVSDQLGHCSAAGDSYATSQRRDLHTAQSHHPGADCCGRIGSEDSCISTPCRFVCDCSTNYP